MGKITIILSHKLENDLRAYINKTYPLKPYGKLSEVVETAVRYYLDHYYLDHIGKTIFLDDEE